MMEIWMDCKRWERMRGKLPKEYKWKAQMAKKRNRKGRAYGGMLVGVKRSVMVEEEDEEEGKITSKIRMGEERRKIV